MKCAVTGRPYTVFGYKGKQVRDNIHSADLVEAFWQFFQAPRGGEVYNLGGGAPQQLLDARGDRDCASRSPAGRCSGPTSTTNRDRRSHLVGSATSGNSGRTTLGGR